MKRHHFWLSAIVSIVVCSLAPVARLLPFLEPSAPLFDVYFLGRPLENWAFNAIFWSLFWLVWARRRYGPPRAQS